MERSSWKRNLSYDGLRDLLQKSFSTMFGVYNIKRNKNRAKFLVYVATGMFHLANGLRNGEAMLSFRYWIEKEDVRDIFDFPVFKQRAYKKDKFGRKIPKKEREWTYRKIAIPNFLKPYKFLLREAFCNAFPNSDDWIPMKFWSPLERVENKDEYRKYESKYSMWWKKNFGFNPHNFRYAWQDYMLGRAPPEIVAKIQGRRNLNIILDYLSNLKAEEYLQRYLGI